MKANVKKFYIQLPEAVETIINKIYEAGHTAYVVGGCVRDTLRQMKPHDWDICTSMKPEETKALFSDDYKVTSHGENFGTIGVVFDGVMYEVTTYRMDGKYSNNRQPDDVVFTDDINLDLVRRDFTINAMAYSPVDGFVDPYGGKRDIKKKLIRCVGNPEERFEEDALRIIRAVRFANNLDFWIEPSTYETLCAKRDLLKNIAVERIHDELVKTLNGFITKKDELLYVLEPIIPEFKDGGYSYLRINEGLKRISRDKLMLHSKLAILFNFKDPQKTKAVLKRLKFSNKDIKAVDWIVNSVQTIWDYNANPNPKYYVRQLLSETDSQEMVYQLATSIYCMSQVETDAALFMAFAGCIVEHLLGEMNNPHTIDALAVSGEELKEKGFEGEQIGNALKYLLNCVMYDDTPNEKDVLLELIDTVVESVGIEAFDTVTQVV